MKRLVQQMLWRRAGAVVRKFNPTVIAVTGSVGKTATRNAIYAVLADHFSVRTAEQNYNNEFGVPLTILGEENPGKSLVGWLRLFWRSYRVKDYPQMLVLEYGLDHPGDIRKLCNLARPHIGVLTAISTVHAEYFDDVEALANEKAEIIRALPEDGLAILNHDDKRVSAMWGETSAHVKTYGLTSPDYSARDVRIVTRKDDHFDPGDLFATTMAYVQKEHGVVGQLVLQNVLGYATVMACLAAVAVADHFEIPVMDVIKTLNKREYKAKGRLNPIAGIKGSLIIDDSYNAAPAAMQNGLKVLKMFEPGEEYDRRIAALGYMAELGRYSEQEHRLIGTKAAEICDALVVVGEPMLEAVEAAKQAGMNESSIHWFKNSKEAGVFLDGFVKEGDIVYVKGSQSSRMERVVKEIMAEPLRAQDLLVRQSDAWLSKK